MSIKVNLSDKGVAWRLEVEPDAFSGKSVGDTINGKELNSDLEGYEFEIRGGSDNAGFPMKKEVEGVGLKRLLFTKGFGMKNNTKGLRKRKTVRGKVITEKTAQINMVILKEGSKKLSEVFPDQNKKEESAPVESSEEKPAEVVA